LYDLVDVELMLTSFSVGELGDLIFNNVCVWMLEALHGGLTCVWMLEALHGGLTVGSLEPLQLHCYNNLPPTKVGC
jgi:hypothetical protein